MRTTSLFTLFWRQRLIISWCLFDVAMGMLLSAFVITFPLYFSHYLSVSALMGTKTWEFNNMLAMIAIALFCPLFGYVVDRWQQLQLWLLVLSTLLFLCMVLLHWVHPQPSSQWLMMLLVMAFILLSNGLRIVYNTILAGIVPPQSLGKVSFFGYLCIIIGGVFGLIVVVQVPNVVQDFKLYSWLLPTVFLVFGLPFILLCCVQEMSLSDNKPLKQRRLGWIKATTDLLKQRNVLYYISGRVFILNGFTAFIIIFTLFVEEQFGLKMSQLVGLFICGGLLALCGGFVFAWLDDRVGAKRVLLIASMSALGCAIGQVFSYHFMSFAIFFALSMVFVGPLATSMRSLLIRIAPPRQIGALIGVCIFIARTTAFISPAIYFGAQSWWHNQRFSLLLSFILIPVGIVLLSCVHERSPASK